ncbi:hypothetical protein JCM1840_006333 [Sporobolomyces johnsonii]
MRSSSAPVASTSAAVPFTAPAASTSAARSPSAPLAAPTESSSDDEALPNDNEHYGARHSLKRIFIGPSYAGAGKGKARAAEPGTGEDAHWDEGGSSSSSSPSEDDEGGGGNGRRAAHARRRVARGRQKEERESRKPTGETVQGNSRRPSAHQWVGGSFEIGADVKAAAKRRKRRLKAERRAREKGERDEKEDREGRGRSASTATKGTAKTGGKSPGLFSTSSYMTAQTHLPPPPASPSDVQPQQCPIPVNDALPYIIHPLARQPSDRPPLNSSTPDSAVPCPATASKAIPQLKSILRGKDEASLNGSALGHGHPKSHPSALLDVPKTIHAIPPPSPTACAPPRPGVPPRATSVRFDPSSSSSTPAFRGPGSGAQPPAPPEEVLSRPAPEPIPDEEKLKDPQPLFRAAKDKKLHLKQKGDEVLRKERMLVRVDWTQREDLPDSFDEHIARKYPTFNEGWEELGVIWRPGRLELWGEYKFNIPAAFVGAKKLKSVIPLQPRKTHLSLYSSVDLIFCLTHRPVPSSLLSSVATRRSTSAAEAPGTDPDGGIDEKILRSPHHSKASKRGYVHLRHAGTNIFLFRARTSSIAKKWIWLLYRELGGQVPRTLEISVPDLGAKIRIPVPRDLPEPQDGGVGALVSDEDREGEGYRLLTAGSVVDACVEQLAKVGEWRDLVEEAQRHGATFRLAWRRDGVLDWVDEGVGGLERDWGVVGGVAFRQESVDPVLELRPAVHYPTIVRMPPSASSKPQQRMAEPPGVEGFVTRYRESGTNERIYLSTHLGLLFISRPSTAHPPEPPLTAQHTVNNPAAIVLAPFVFGMASIAATPEKQGKMWRRVSDRGGMKAAKQEKSRREWTLKSMEAADGERLKCDLDDEDGRGMLELFEKEERKRAFLQISDARGFVSLSEIETIEHELEEAPREKWVRVVDPGGEDGLKVADDKQRLRKLRSFVVKTRSGMTVKFECHSTNVCDEWVSRLSALVTYWRRRERVDAIRQMEISPHGGLVKHLPPFGSSARHDDDDDAEPPPAREELLSSPLLAQIYNWCILDGCRAVLKHGVLHVKKGLRGMFRKRHVLLLPGTLIEYQSFQRDLYGQPLATPYHRRKFTLSLRDCYCYSGSLTAALLRGTTNTTAWDPANTTQHHFPRCYTTTDGLRTTDDDEDCTFVILRMKHGGHGGGKTFGQKGVARVYRARSKVERDQFVYALNCAIERLLRGEQEREERLRDFSWLEQQKEGGEAKESKAYTST